MALATAAAAAKAAAVAADASLIHSSQRWIVEQMPNFLGLL
jgi:hypothetical protein